VKIQRQCCPSTFQRSEARRNKSSEYFFKFCPATAGRDVGLSSDAPGHDLTCINPAGRIAGKRDFDRSPAATWGAVGFAWLQRLCCSTRFGACALSDLQPGRSEQAT
jgi:hypothetical protein